MCSPTFCGLGTKSLGFSEFVEKPRDGRLFLWSETGGDEKFI